MLLCWRVWRFRAVFLRVLSGPAWARVVGTLRSLPFFFSIVGWGKALFVILVFWFLLAVISALEVKIQHQDAILHMMVYGQIILSSN